MHVETSTNTDEGSDIDVRTPTDDASFCFHHAPGRPGASPLLFVRALKLPLQGVYMTADTLFALIICLA